MCNVVYILRNFKKEKHLVISYAPALYYIFYYHSYKLWTCTLVIARVVFAWTIWQSDPKQALASIVATIG